MKHLAMIVLALSAIVLVGCDALTVVPRQPTQTPLPTRAPTVPPSPTVPPTATLPPATATLNPAANPLDALKSAFGGWSNVKSFRIKSVRAAGSTTSESTFEVVLPDRFHIIGKDEIIIIGSTLYTKKGTTWTKTQLPKDFDLSFADYKKLLEQLGAATDVKFIGPDILDGAPMLVYQYTSTFKVVNTSVTSVSKVWIAVSDRLPRKSESTSNLTGGSKTVSTYSNYNDPLIIINAPIK